MNLLKKTEEHELPNSDHTEVAAKDPATEVDDIEKTDAGAFVWLVASTASIGGMLFGYDTGIISAVLVYLHDDLGHFLSPSEKEMVTSLCSAGSFVGAIIAGLTADKYGRKGAMYIACVLFTVGAILQASAYSIPQMVVGRFIVGFGVGSAAMVVPAYIAEIAPTKYRGRMTGLNNVSITGGQVISYALGAAFAPVPSGWRYMVGLGAVPSLLFGALLPFCPESPRQLVYHGKHEQAAGVLQRIFHNASPEQVSAKIRLIDETVQQSRLLDQSHRRRAIVKQLHTNAAYFRALVCACGLMVIGQMSGFNVLMYYSGTLFSLVGFSNPVAVSLVVSVTNFVMTCVNMAVVDPFGRRRLLVSTVWGMGVGLLAVAVAFLYLPIDLETLEMQEKEVTTPAIVVLVFIIWFVIFYGVSIGNTAWMSTDFFPMEVRAIGSMYMTCCCWGSNLIVSSTFLSMMKGITPSGAFGFYAAICLIGWVLIILFYPEMSGLTLEEAQEVFRHGFGVKYASALRKARRNGSC
ncbi:myo-inositol transporter [Aspergillus luchuensis]|nr:myo-inositol transporter [Aspergillus luchuensis]BCS04954.1 myo-inositol transporter [Aspergillus luchuensis]GAA85843.1 MFS sugar transporter [Aspergillus luchuensis IFO 4308]